MPEFSEGLFLKKAITTKYIISNTTNLLRVKLNINKWKCLIYTTDLDHALIIKVPLAVYNWVVPCL